jgi:hypothetical protein
MRVAAGVTQPRTHTHAAFEQLRPRKEGGLFLSLLMLLIIALILVMVRCVCCQRKDGTREDR